MNNEQPAAVTRTNLYRFDQFDESDQEKILDDLRAGWLDYEWWDYIYDDAEAIGEIMGIRIDDIWFSGFASQGDGACFEGTYGYEKGSVQKLKQYAPKDEELHKIAEGLLDVQRRNFYQLCASVRHTGDISVERDNDYGQDLSDSDEETVIDLLRDFMRWIYKRLEEQIEANDFLFDEDGNIRG